MTVLAAGFTSGSILIATAVIGSAVGVITFMLRIMPKGGAAIESAERAADLAQRNAEQWHGIADSRGEQIKDLHEDLRVERDAKSVALEAGDISKDEIAGLRETVAELRARPDTQQMLGTFESHHLENQAAMKVMADNQTLMIANQAAGLEELKNVGLGITRLLERNKPTRSTDT